MDIRSFFGGTAVEKGGISITSTQQPPTRSKKELPQTIEPAISATQVAEKENSSTDDQEIKALSSCSILPADIAPLVSWQHSQPVPYAALVSTFEAIGDVAGRLEKERHFERFFRAVILTTPSELEIVVYLAANAVAPVYAGMELGIGDSLLVKAICEATGRKREAVEEAYEKEGDLGTVALMSRAQQRTLSFAAKPKPLTCQQVLEQFRLITQTKGERAQGRKVDIIRGLMVRCASQSSEAKFIVRALQGKLRIGTAQQTVLVGLAHAALNTQLPALANMVVRDAILADVSNKQKQEKADEALESTDSASAVATSATTISTALENEENSEAVDCGDFQEMISALKLRDTVEATELRHFLQKRFQNQLKAATTEEHEVAATNAEAAVKRAYSECPNYSILVQNLLQFPLYALHTHSCLAVGVPVAPMLAKPSKKITEVIQRLSGLEFTMEYKYDGERAQVHLMDDAQQTVKIFSRNSEDNSEKYPDLRDVVRLAKSEGVTSCILDCEVVAYDRVNKCLLPFQVLSTRKRKVEAGEEDAQKVKVILQVFDLLFLNGKPLLREPLRLRRSILQRCFAHKEGLLHFAVGLDHAENGDTGPIEIFLQEACTTGLCEGLMVKTLDGAASNYEPSKRSMNWLKLKKDYIDGMGVADSVDLVVLGGYLGRGKRTNVYGAYLMACYDADRDEFQSVCKVGTGFKDEDLARLTAKIQEHHLLSYQRQPPSNYNVSDALLPDHWFDASCVWELQAADLSRSSVHSGGVGRLDDNNKLLPLNKRTGSSLCSGAGGQSQSLRGIGLRFPRFLRERDDKKPQDATSAEQIVEMFLNQSVATSNAGGTVAAGEEEEEDDWL